MWQQFQKHRRLKRFQAPVQTCHATLKRDADQIALTVGAVQAFLRDQQMMSQTPTGDFAVFALCALSMSKNWAIKVDFPVTMGLQAKCTEIANAYRLWSIDALAPLRLEFSQVVPDVAPVATEKIICLSGGLDSLSAAVEAVQSGQTTTGLLVAGADYVDAQQSGFVELRARVQSVAEKLELELRVAETNLRRVGFHWELMHGFNLAFCLHSYSGEFGAGAFAQDNNAVQDLFRAPWGNMNVLPALFSTPGFPIGTYGADKTRVTKLQSVLEYDETLLQHLSVCYTNKRIGGNCGKCPKCIQTRIALLANGYDGAALFEEQPELVTAVRRFKVPKRLDMIRGRMGRVSELVDALPDGELRDALLEFEGKMRQRFYKLMPPMIKP